MAIDSSLLETLFSQVPLLVGLTWWIATEKSNIEKEIDRVNDSHNTQIAFLDKTLSLLIQEYQSTKKSLEDKIDGQGRRFGSKLERLEGRVNDVLDFKVINKKLDKIGRSEED